MQTSHLLRRLIDKTRTYYKWAGLVLLIIAFLFVKWASAPPQYEFDFSGATDRAEIGTLCAFADRFQRAMDWSPWQMYGDGRGNIDDWARAIAAVIRLPANQRAENGLDLLRAYRTESDSASDDGPSGELIDDAEIENKIPVFNAAIVLLADRLDRDTLRLLREAENDELVVQSLRTQLELALDERRQRNIERLASDSALAGVLEGYGGPAFPDTPNVVRRLVGEVTDAQNRDRERWVAAFRAAVMRDVVPAETWRTLLAKTSDLHIGAEKDSWLVLKRTSEPVELTGLSGSDDFKVYVATRGSRLTSATDGNEAQHKADQPPAVLLDTGIQVLRLPLFLEQSNEASIGYRWPPKSVAAEPAVLEKFMRRLGLPKFFAIRDLSLERTGTVDEIGIALNFTIFHKEIKECSWQQRVVLTEEQLHRTLQGLTKDFDSANDRLREQLPSLTQFKGLPVKIVPAPDDDCRFHCQFEYPGIGAITFGLGISEQGQLVLSGSPNAAERQRIARRICEATPALKGLDYLLTIDEVNLDEPMGELTGASTINGRAIDAPDDLGEVRWHIDKRTAAAVELEGADLQYLRGLKTRIAQLPRPGSDDPKVLGEQITTYLRSKYSKLDGVVEIVGLDATDHGAYLKLGLLIGDWPEITLGPIQVDAGNFATVIETLLTEENVRQAAAKQWGQPRHHVRLGLSTGNLIAWSSEECDATIEWQMPIQWIGNGDDGQPRVQLRCLELQRRVGGLWQDFIKVGDDADTEFTTKSLCAALEPRIAEIERQVASFMSLASGTDMEVRVERDGFGPGQWLRLSPPAIRVWAACKVPFLPIKVGAGRILLDQKAIHMPEEFTAEYRRTFPATSFNVSDPRVRINTTTYGVALGCKITPPFPPAIPISPGDPDSATEKAVRKWLASAGLPDDLPLVKLRLDNPWLHAIYLDCELRGALHKSQSHLGARGNLWLIDTYNAASADLQVNIRDPSIRGHLRAQAPVLEGLARLSGDVSISRRNGMYLTGILTVAGADVASKIYYHDRPEGTRVGLRGRTHLPLIGDVEVRGDSDLSFRDVKVTADGAATIGRLGIVRFNFSASSAGGYHFSCRWATAAGEAEYVCSGYSVNEISERELENELERCIRNSKRPDSPIKPPSEDEKKVIARLPSMPPLPKREVPEDFDVANMSNPENSERYVSNLRWHWKPKGGKEPQSLRFYSMSSRGETEILNLTLADPRPFTPSSKTCRFWLLPKLHDEKDSQGGGDLLVVDSRGKKIWHLECDKPANIENKDDLTEKLAHLNVFSQDERHHSLAVYAVAKYVGLRARGFDPNSPQSKAAGWLIEYPSRAENGSVRYWFGWASKSRRYSVGFSAALFPSEQQTEGFFKLLRTLKPQATGELVYVGTEGSGRAAVLYESSVPSANTLVFYGKQSERSIHVELTEADDKAPVLRRLLGCQLIAKSFFDNKILQDSQQLTAYLGPGGICLISDNDMWVTRPPAPLPDQQATLHRVSPAAFVAWNHENERHLPDWLDSEEEREEQWKSSRHKIAKLIVTAWNEQRESGEWGANPLGLLMAISTQGDQDNENSSDSNSENLR